MTGTTPTSHPSPLPVVRDLREGASGTVRGNGDAGRPQGECGVHPHGRRGRGRAGRKQQQQLRQRWVSSCFQRSRVEGGTLHIGDGGGK